MTVETFEEAKQLSIKKWSSILKKLEVVSCDTGEWCGFCLLAQYKFEESGHIDTRCTHCLVVEICDEYKTMTMDLLNEYMKYVESLIEWLNEFEIKYR